MCTRSRQHLSPPRTLKIPDSFAAEKGRSRHKVEADCTSRKVGTLSWGGKGDDGWETAGTAPTENNAAQVRAARPDPAVHDKVLRDNITVIREGTER